VYSLGEPDKFEQPDKPTVRAVDLERTTSPHGDELQPRHGIDRAQVRGRHPRDVEVCEPLRAAIVMRSRQRGLLSREPAPPR